MQVGHSRTPAKRENWAGPLIAAGQTFSGIVLALAPVALWVAWSPAVFLVVVAGIAASTGVFLMLHECEHAAAGVSPAAPRSRAAAFDAEEFIEEVHSIFPLTYHHSLRGRTRFRRAMQKLRRLAYRRA